MKIPAEITTIITQIGVRNLTFSEKRKLVDWYQQLNRDSNIQLTEEESTITEKKIFSAIEESIAGESKLNIKSDVFCSWLKRLLPCWLLAQNFNGFFILFE